MPDTFGTFIGINLVNLQAHENGIVRTFRLADVTVDAVFRDF